MKDNACYRCCGEEPEPGFEPEGLNDGTAEKDATNR